MSVSAKNTAGAAVFNLPNQLTVLRLILSVVLFALMAFRYHLTSTIVFIIAASTDWLDGYFARKYNLVTVLGRILDPFVDKVIICGAFIFLVAEANSGVKAWMAVVVVARELLVTALRGHLEGEGVNFSAAMSGKLKMVLQCVAVGMSLFYLSYDAIGVVAPAWLWYLVLASVWSAVVLTIYSGAVYVIAAISLIRR
ncbi:MAG: CDP-diacylglycerol--glycerol-3-phosphate 3-phosphatidyltransferase [Pirellulales bacterium]|nr:CDP-diacylglycerol--glycerol-3-phosphate 3-phosphatidyltransferase [Pirellulales bacterium]